MPQAKILLADNDPDTRELLVGILEDEGYGVQHCATGESALAALKEKRFDLLVAEILMKPVGGLDLLRHVRAAGPAINVIVMTAYATPETIEAARQGQAFDYIVKPFALQRFREQVARALNSDVTTGSFDGIL
jgi:two-component system response regulator PilR (NtrC family)